jgi:hypothetical protein
MNAPIKAFRCFTTDGTRVGKFRYVTICSCLLIIDFPGGHFYWLGRSNLTLESDTVRPLGMTAASLDFAVGFTDQSGAVGVLGKSGINECQRSGDRRADDRQPCSHGALLGHGRY